MKGRRQSKGRQPLQPNSKHIHPHRTDHKAGKRNPAGGNHHNHLIQPFAPVQGSNASEGNPHGQGNQNGNPAQLCRNRKFTGDNFRNRPPSLLQAQTEITMKCSCHIVFILNIHRFIQAEFCIQSSLCLLTNGFLRNERAARYHSH